MSGRLQLEFAWDVTARSLLSLKLAALENVLCQRTEILCALNPVPAAKAFGWIQKALGSPKLPQQACFLLTPRSLLGVQIQQWCPQYVVRSLCAQGWTERVCHIACAWASAQVE